MSARRPDMPPSPGAEVLNEHGESRGNHGFDKVERLAGNIGYLKLSRFSRLDEAKDTAAAAMDFLAYSDVIIFGVRDCAGGPPMMVAFLSS